MGRRGIKFVPNPPDRLNKSGFGRIVLQFFSQVVNMNRHGVGIAHMDIIPQHGKKLFVFIDPVGIFGQMVQQFKFFWR